MGAIFGYDGAIWSIFISEGICVDDEFVWMNFQFVVLLTFNRSCRPVSPLCTER